jgi:hypothetical protein
MCASLGFDHAAAGTARVPSRISPVARMQAEGQVLPETDVYGSSRERDREGRRKGGRRIWAKDLCSFSPPLFFLSNEPIAT